MKPPPALKAGDDPLLHKLTPLTQRMRDGTPYARYADVESQIESVIATAPDTWEVTKLKSETLVYLVRWLWPQGGDKTLGPIIDCLGRRIARIARDFMGDLVEPVAEELVFEITQDVNLKIFALTPSRQSEFLEVAFRTAIRRRVINAVEKHSERLHTEVTSSAFESDSAEGCEEMLIETFSDGEGTPLDDMVSEETVRNGLAAITDQRHREAVVLRYLHGWPVKPSDPTTACLCSHFKKSARMMQIWINTAKDEMRAAMGSDI